VNGCEKVFRDKLVVCLEVVVHKWLWVVANLVVNCWMVSHLVVSQWMVRKLVAQRWAVDGQCVEGGVNLDRCLDRMNSLKSICRLHWVM